MIISAPLMSLSMIIWLPGGDPVGLCCRGSSGGAGTPGVSCCGGCRPRRRPVDSVPDASGRDLAYGRRLEHIAVPTVDTPGHTIRLRQIRLSLVAFFYDCQ